MKYNQRASSIVRTANAAIAGTKDPVNKEASVPKKNAPSATACSKTETSGLESGFRRRGGENCMLAVGGDDATTVFVRPNVRAKLPVEAGAVSLVRDDAPCAANQA